MLIPLPTKLNKIRPDLFSDLDPSSKIHQLRNTTKYRQLLDISSIDILLN